MNKIENTLFTNDNLFILNGLNSESVDLIYLDPPFNSKRMYSAPIGSKSAGASFKDMWTWNDVDESYLEELVLKYPALVEFIKSIALIHSKAMMAYITYMTQRLIQMHRILKKTGSLYLHVDPTASHYLKIVLDSIFDKNNFKNEIIWCYSNSGRTKKNFAKKHDVILLYSKSDKYHWDYSIPISQKYLNSHYKQVDSKGQKCRIRIDAGKERIYYPNTGMTCNDWWSDIPSLNSQAKERKGYPTQKPIALLQRIIKASSKEGDLILDPFCGCATTCVAAQREKRRWIGIDIEANASKVLIDRFNDDLLFHDENKRKTKDFTHRTDIPQRTDIKIVRQSKQVRERLYEEQKEKCNACETKFRILDLELDHIIPKSKGGGDYYENYQLLCANCNRIKGDRPMEYLRMKIAKRQEEFKKIDFGD